MLNTLNDISSIRLASKLAKWWILHLSTSPLHPVTINNTLD